MVDDAGNHGKQMHNFCEPDPTDLVHVGRKTHSYVNPLHVGKFSLQKTINHDGLATIGWRCLADYEDSEHFRPSSFPDWKELHGDDAAAPNPIVAIRCVVLAQQPLAGQSEDTRHRKFQRTTKTTFVRRTFLADRT